MRARRSSFDGRDSYYRLDLDRCAQRSPPPVTALHPGLRLRPPTADRATAARPRRRPRCCSCAPATAPAPRSPKRCCATAPASRVEVASAGSHPKAAAPQRGPGHARASASTSPGSAHASTSTSSTGQPFRLRDHASATRSARSAPSSPAHPERDPLEHPRPAAAGAGDRATATPPSSALAADLDTRIGFLHPVSRPTTAQEESRHDTTDSSSTSATSSTTSQAALDFYTTHLGFTVRTSAAPAFADVTRGNLRLLLSGPASSAGRPMPDGARPVPGGWNRIHLIVDDIDAEIARLRAAGVTFRSDIVTGPGGAADPARRPRRQPDRTVPAPQPT